MAQTGPMTAPPRATPPLRSRFRYAVGGALPAHRAWVRHDLTDPGWQLRLLGRVAFQLAPFVVIAAVVPGIDGLARGLLIALLLLSSLMISAIAAEQIRDRRLRQHGFPVAEDEDERYRNARRY